MPRFLQAFLVGVLTLSLSMDSARACWYLRQRQRCCPPVACVPGGWEPCGRPVACGAVVVVSDVACGTVVHGGRAWAACEEIACGVPVECCGSANVAASAVAPPAAAASAPTADASGDRAAAPAAESVVAPRAATPTVVDAAPTIVPVEPPPVLEPAADVRPASNDVPVPGVAAGGTALTEPPAPAVEPPAAPVVPAEPAADESPVAEARPTLPTDDAESNPLETALPPVADPEPTEGESAERVSPEPEDEPAPEDNSEPVMEPELVVEPEPAVEPAKPENPFEADEEPAVDDVPEPDVEQAAPPALNEDPFEAPSSDDVPLAETDPVAVAEEAVDTALPLEPVAPPEDAPAPEPDAAAPADGEGLFDEPAAGEPGDDSAPPAEPAASRSREPARRWVNQSGTYAIVATLVDVRGDGGCVLEADGRLFVVPVANLSRRDAEYVAEAGQRLAATRAGQPAVGDTAGL